ncbi:MAG: glycosyltransferase family 2 protein [Alistipes sp.]|nr:glycosyltransferase family 2 protein [Alistipes sp.]
MSDPSISVIIPLYNKEREIAGTLRSVLAQTLQPAEIVVVDDGSTDRSAEVVETVAAGEGGGAIRLVRQSNAGVSVARNRGAAEAQGEYVAFLDADDEWESGFLAEITALIREFPGCGIYSTAFWVVDGKGRFPAPCPERRGVVDNFFRDSAHRYISIPSASVVSRRVFDEVGGFPAGMKIGEDLYLWIEIARRWPVCFSPARLCRYSKVASNRSSAIYTPEQTAFSFESLYDPAAPVEEREFIARAALGKALIVSAKGGTAEAARAIRTFSFTRTYRRTLRKVRVLNALPVGWRAPLLDLYNRLAWAIAGKGL